MADNQVSLYKKAKSGEKKLEGQESEIQEGEQVNVGIEEQEVEYVTLMSSDNHEYILEKKYVLVSGTIRAMLSGPGKIMYISIVTMTLTIIKFNLNFSSVHKIQCKNNIICNIEILIKNNCAKASIKT